MEFQDKLLSCVDCGTEFVWTAGEQHFFADKNFKNEPKRCKGCKAKRAARPSAGGPAKDDRHEARARDDEGSKEAVSNRPTRHVGPADS